MRYGWHAHVHPPAWTWPTTPRRRPGWHRLIDHNPFYLVSGVLMLAGCYAISVDTHGQPDALPPLLKLVGVTWVYQLLVLAAALWLGGGLGGVFEALVVGRGRAGIGGGGAPHPALGPMAPAEHVTAAQRRDASHLLVVWLLLAVDGALLYHELLTRSVTWGYGMTAGAVTLTVAGVTAAGWRLRLGLTPAAWAVVVGDLVLVYVVPAFYRRWGDSGYLPDLAEWRMAWAVGIWLALHAAVRTWRTPQSSAAHWGLVKVLLIALPVVAVVAHVYLGNFTYSRHWVEFFAWNHLTPLALGLSAVVAGWGFSDDTRRAARQVALAVAGFGVAVALVADAPRLALPRLDNMPIYVSVLAVTGLAAVLLWVWVLHRGVGLLIGGYVLALWALWMHLPPRLGRAGRVVVDAGAAVTPDGGVGWGTVAVVLAFVTLGLGVVVSWRERVRRAAGAAGGGTAGGEGS